MADSAAAARPAAAGAAIVARVAAQVGLYGCLNSMRLTVPLLAAREGREVAARRRPVITKRAGYSELRMPPLLHGLGAVRLPNNQALREWQSERATRPDQSIDVSRERCPKPSD